MHLTVSKPVTFIALLTFCLLRALSSVGALDERPGDEHHAIGSFSTDPEEDEIILNKENLRPEYSQTKGATVDDDFRLQVASRSPRGNRKCLVPFKEISSGTVFTCNPGCKFLVY